jgi:heme o synthase
MLGPEPVLATSDASVLRPQVFVRPTTWSDYWALTKPDVNVLIGLTTITAFVLASETSLAAASTRVMPTLVGTLLVASGAAALNQWLEHRFDARMRRTARRPIAAGRIEPVRALAFGLALSIVGVIYLALAANVLASSLAILTLTMYLCLYTPLKRVTPLCTLVGAVPGAMPPLIGWAAARGRLDPEAWILFTVVFLWQFPHFMAIAWMYRDDYQRAGYKVLPRGHIRGRFAALQSALALLALIPVTALSMGGGQFRMVYQLGAILMGLAFACYGLCFMIRRSGSSSRQLLRASILYLPVLLIWILLLKG